MMTLGRLELNDFSQLKIIHQRKIEQVLQRKVNFSYMRNIIIFFKNIYEFSAYLY